MLINYFKIEGFKLKSFFKLLYAKFLEEDILSSAAQIAFYFSFALFPLLLFLLSLLGMVLGSADDLRRELFYYLRQVMPYSAYELVQKTIEEVTQSSSGGKLTLGLFVALWSASAGIDSIRIALNSVFNLDETRAWWKTKAISLTQTLVIALLTSAALGFVFYGWKFASLALETVHLPVPSPFFLVVIQIVSVFVLLVAVFAILYNFSPDYKPHKWVWITPGTITGIILFIAFSEGFRLYLHYFNSYNKTYGSLGAVIILLLWLYLTALVILIGSLINATLQEMSDPETAAAGEKGVGENKEKNKETEQEKAEKTDSKIETTADKAAHLREEVKAETEHETIEKSDAKKIDKPANLQKQVEPKESKYLETIALTKTQTKLKPGDLKNKSWLNLAVGGLFGVFIGLKIKNKRK